MTHAEPPSPSPARPAPASPFRRPASSATDHVLVTPPPGFADTFTLTGRPEPSTNTVVFAACNTFTAAAVTPMEWGGPYKVLVIR